MKEMFDLEVDIYGFEMWEDFDRIAKFITTKFNARVIQKVDGPDARFCKFLIGDVTILLIFDDMIGNFLRAPNKESLDKTKLFVKEIETFMNLESVNQR